LFTDVAGIYFPNAIASPSRFYVDRELSVGRRYPIATGSGDGEVSVTGTGAYGGVDGYVTEITSGESNTVFDEDALMWGLTVRPGLGLPLQSVSYETKGDRTQAPTLVSYESR